MLLDRSYFALQARFAARVADIEGLDFGEACRLHTAFYALARDNDAGLPPDRNDFDPAHPKWVEFLEEVGAGADPVDFVYQAYLEGDAQGDTGERCFDFEYWPEDRLVRIHFSNNRAGTALHPSAGQDRIRELHDIFAVVRHQHPDAAIVRGTSWLYHLEAYRRLFPPSFVAGLRSVGHPHQFAALWAQFIDRHGVVKPKLAERFHAQVDTATTLAELDEAFPLDVLATTGDVATFHEHYGVLR